MKTIHYYLQGADESGVKLHPQTQVEKLGMKVLAYEGCEIADSVFMEVDEIIYPLPDYIVETTYKLVKYEN